MTTKHLCYLLSSILILSFACKKKDEPKEEPPVAVPAPKQVSVKINNTLFTCDICANTYYSGGMHGLNVSEPGTQNRFVFSFDTLPSVGTHVLSKQGPVIFTYEKNGRYYKGKGSLNITERETGGSSSMKVFKGSFSCDTDTASDGTHFSEGQLNLNFK